MSCHYSKTSNGPFNFPSAVGLRPIPDLHSLLRLYIPLNPSGKTLRPILRDSAESHPAPPIPSFLLAKGRVETGEMNQTITAATIIFIVASRRPDNL